MVSHCLNIIWSWYITENIQVSLTALESVSGAEGSSCLFVDWLIIITVQRGNDILNSSHSGHFWLGQMSLLIAGSMIKLKEWTTGIRNASCNSCRWEIHLSLMNLSIKSLGKCIIVLSLHILTYKTRVFAYWSDHFISHINV